MVSTTDQGHSSAEKPIRGVYHDRNVLARAFAWLAYTSGFEAGYYVHDEWVVVFVELPQGMVSWHVRPESDGVPEELPRYDPGVFDGHNREQKNQRLVDFAGQSGGAEA